MLQEILLVSWDLLSDRFGVSFSSFCISIAIFQLEACGPSYPMSSNVFVVVLSNVVEVSWTVTTNEGRKKGKGFFQAKKITDFKNISFPCFIDGRCEAHKHTDCSLFAVCS